MQKCERCGINAESNLCFRCKRRKPISVRKPMPRAINTERIQIEMKDTSMMQAFFLSVWIKRPHKSELDSTYLGNTHLSIYFHHILPKKKFPQAKYDPENIILLTLDQHSNVESDMYRYPEINRRRELLKLKYDVT